MRPVVFETFPVLHHCVARSLGDKVPLWVLCSIQLLGQPQNTHGLFDERTSLQLWLMEFHVRD